MVATVKFSAFSAINKAGTNSLVGLSNGRNAISTLPINWTTAGRPVAPTNGFSGYNISLSQWEYWNGMTSTWVQFSAGGAGSVTAIATGTGLTGGVITTTGTVSLIVPVVVNLGGTGVTTIPAYSVICGGVTGTSAVQTVSGLGTAGQVLTSNGAGVLPTWQPSASSGTVNPGLVNQLAWYDATGDVVSGLGTSANGVLVTSAGSVPSISQTLPAAVQANITTLGTITAGVWNGSTIDVPHGGTANTSFTAFALICGGTTSTGALQSVVGLGTAGQVLTSNGAGVLPTFQSLSGTGTVTSVGTAGLATGGTITTTGTITVTAATQANMEADSSNAVAVTPGVMRYTPGINKAWVYYTEITTTTIKSSYGVTSLTDGGTGITTVNYSTSFSSANVNVLPYCNDNVNRTFTIIAANTAASCTIRSNNFTGTLTDMPECHVTCMGDF